MNPDPEWQIQVPFLIRNKSYTYRTHCKKISALMNNWIIPQSGFYNKNL